MALYIYNTIKRKKEPFVPLKDKRIGMYVCGVTVYDLPHIGHARALVVFDVIFRYLQYLGYDVTYVRNYTDVDDKIIVKANEKGVSIHEITNHYIREFNNDMESLGVLNPTYAPRATEHIQDMINMVKTLIEKDFAYEMNGDVYFDVSRCSNYGKLSGKKPDELYSGARVEIDERKKNPLDFALWKKSEPDEPFWESPWGRGRPGWHLECSVMSQKYLGTTLDIHGGGMDLIFPHHENEIAQSESATGKQFVRYWIHNGFVNINHEKMSKSLKNFFTIREILQKIHSEALRLFLLSHHYRSPVDFSDKHVSEATVALDKFYALLKDLREAENRTGKPIENTTLERRTREYLNSFPGKFTDAMNDDFNTAAALGHLFTLMRAMNALLTFCKKDAQLKPPADLIKQALGIFQEVGGVFGLFKENPFAYFQSRSKKRLSELSISTQEIDRLIKQREAERRAKNWKLADAIRSQLAEKGIILKDTASGTEWQVKED